MQITLLLVDVKPSHGRIDAVPLFPITKIFKSVSGTSPSKGSLYFLNVVLDNFGNISRRTIESKQFVIFCEATRLGGTRRRMK